MEVAPAGEPRRVAILRRIERRAPWIAAVAVLIAALATLNADPVGVFFDDALYALLAKAIAEGRGYVWTSIPGNPAAIHYPPAWPALLALVWKVGPAFPGNLAWLKLVNPVLLACAAYGATAAGTRLFGVRPLLAMCTAIAGLVAVGPLAVTNQLLSEPLFLALLFPALIASESALRVLLPAGGAGPSTRLAPVVRAILLAAALAALLTLTRTVGGVVPIAMVLVLILRRAWWQGALYLAAVVLLLAPWQLFVAKHAPTFPPEIAGSYGPYLAWLVDGYRDGGLPFARAVLDRNVGETFGMLSAALVPISLGGLHLLAIGYALVLVPVGLASAWRRGAPVTALAVAGYLAVVYTWPFDVVRFLTAVWPLLLLLALVGGRAVRQGLAGRAAHAGRVGVSLLLALLASGYVGSSVRYLAEGWASKASGDMRATSHGVLQQALSDERLTGRVLAALEAPMLAFYTGQQVVPIDALLVTDWLRPKTPEERREVLRATDRRFKPSAYVMPGDGPFLDALLSAPLDSGRTLQELKPTLRGVRAFLVVPGR